jgi:hypothetical protein
VKKKYIRVSLRILCGLLVLILLLYVGLSWYVSSHKKELLQKATTEISSLLHGEVGIDDMSVSFFKNFPSLALQLKNISIRDSAFSQHGHPFLQVQNLYVRVNPFRLITGKIHISKLELDSGSLYLFTDTSGYTNTYLLKPKKKDSTTTAKKKQPASDLFSKIELHRFSFTQEDRIKDKLFDLHINDLSLKTSSSENGSLLDIDESILVRSLAFKKQNGVFLENHLLKGKFTIRLNAENGHLSFDSIPINISRQNFRLTGLFKLGREKEFELKVYSQNMLVDFGRSLVTKKIARGVGLVPVTRPLDLQGTISGSLAGGDPLVTVKWNTEHNEIRTPLMDFSDCSFTGMYTNEVQKGLPRKDPNSKVEVYNLSGNWRGLPVTIDKVTILDLKSPVVDANLRSAFTLNHLNDVLQSNSLSLSEGSGTLHLQFKGPLKDMSPQNASLNGLLKIQNGNILMHGPGATLSNCNANIRFVNTDIFIDTLRCSIQNNPIFFSGAAKNVLALIGPSNGGMSLLLNVNAQLVNIEKLSSVISRKFPSKKPKQTGGTNLNKTAQQLDNLLSSGNIQLNFNAGRVLYHKFEARAVSASISVDADTWRLQKASLQHGSGSIQVSATVSQKSATRFGMDANVIASALDAQKIFYQFDNFGLKSLHYNNLKGSLSANANLSLLLDNKGNFDMSSLTGSAAFSLKNGELINFKPLEEIQKVAFKKRDFSDVTFAEIKDNISFNKGDIYIDRMEINSSVLSLFAEGRYSLSGTNTDMSIQVPLSNLKKRDADYKPENLGTDRSGGMSIFLRAKSNPDGSIKIAYDPLKKFRKKTPKKET